MTASTESQIRALRTMLHDSEDRVTQFDAFHEELAVSNPTDLEDFYIEVVPFLDLFGLNACEYRGLPLVAKLNPPLARRLKIFLRAARG